MGLSLISHLLFLAFLLWLPPPSLPGEYAITVRLALASPPPPPEEPLPPPAERAKREPPPEPPPKPQVKPAPTPSPSARSAQDSPQRSAGEARAKEGGKAGPEGPRLGKSAEGVGVPGERALGVRPSGTEGKGEVPGMPKPEAERTAPAPGVPSAGSEELASLAHARPLGESGEEEKLGPSGLVSPSQSPSASREGLAPRSLGEAGVGADPLDSPGRGLVGPDPLGKGQGRASGEEAGACALVVDVSPFPFTPNPSPALLDPEGNVVWPAEDRVQGVPERVVEESGIALFLRKGQFSEKGYAQVFHVRAIGTRPRAPGSRFYDFALLDREGAERVKEVPPFCQVVFLY